MDVSVAVSFGFHAFTCLTFIAVAWYRPLVLATSTLLVPLWVLIAFLRHRLLSTMASPGGMPATIIGGVLNPGVPQYILETL